VDEGALTLVIGCVAEIAGAGLPSGRRSISTLGRTPLQICCRFSYR
jgi:hypothetical protein